MDQNIECSLDIIIPLKIAYSFILTINNEDSEDYC